MVSPYTFNVRNHVLNERFNAVTLSLGSLTQADTSELKYHLFFSLCVLACESDVSLQRIEWFHFTL
jgi:hypothetical protein